MLATQNPIENEGTYPLPEAQLDRFMLKVHVGYPSARGRARGAAAHGPAAGRSRSTQVLEPKEILGLPRAPSPTCTSTRRWWTTSWTSCARRASRPTVGLADLKPLIDFGASPRATLALASAARAHAFLRGRAYVIPEDVRALAPDVLRHRIVLTFEAEAENVTSDDVVTRAAGGREGAVDLARHPQAGQGHRAPHARARDGALHRRVPLRVPRAGDGVRRGARVRAGRRLPRASTGTSRPASRAPSSRRTPRSASSR